VIPEKPDLQAGSQIITIQQLRHIVPKKALKETERADKARAKDRQEEVIDHMNRAIRLDPEFVAARNNLAALYLRINDPEPAIAQLEEAIKIDPHNPTLFTNLAIAYTEVGKFDAAERAARVTVDLDRIDGLPRFLLGITLVYQQKFTDEALQCFEQTGDGYPLAHLLAGRVLIARNSLELAKTEIQTYLSSREQRHRLMATQWLDIIERNEQRSAVSAPQ
jgi:Flp pilus assembly protein TadD